MVQFCQDTLCRLRHTNIPICCPQQQITGRYAKPVDYSPHFNKKMYGWEMHITEVNRQVRTENSYALCYVYNICSPVRLNVIKVCKHFRRTFQHHKVYSIWRYCGWDSNNNWKSPTSGKAIELLLNLTLSLMYWNINKYKLVQ